MPIRSALATQYRRLKRTASKVRDTTNIGVVQEYVENALLPRGVREVLNALYALWVSNMCANVD